uniref:Uncharacterized protein n=1 Tax=Rhizophora mucronata TaxID=61149 RepID=A0A2P2PE56_RHIMU
MPPTHKFSKYMVPYNISPPQLSNMLIEPMNLDFHAFKPSVPALSPI